MSDSEVENQKINKKSDIKEVDKYLNKAFESVCKIIAKESTGTGFLIKLYKDEEELFCLLANEHLINKDMIKSKEIIDVNYKYEEKWLKIKLDKTQRTIKCDSEKDFTIIEIKPDDKIKVKYFLLPNINKINFINQEIYIIQFPDGEKLSHSEGKIREIDKFKYYYDASIKHSSSGGPILLKNTTTVIGIHKGYHKIKKINQGIQINSIIELLQSKKEKIIDIEVHENNEYYIGQSLNGLKHGKGIIFDQFNNIIYEGEFKKGEKEGSGRYNYEIGEYYIGDWLKGKKHGKGILYNKNNDIIYEGDYVNDKREGERQYIESDGEFYIGQFKNDKFNGQGKYIII